MRTCHVSITLQEELLTEIDEVAREESRSRSEFLCEAARTYIQRKRGREDIFSMGQMIAKDKGLVPEDVSAEIAEYRKETLSERQV